MPGFATHDLFGREVYRALQDPSLRCCIRRHTASYRLGLQGPDLFYYNLPLLQMHDCRNIGSFMHKHDTNRFFACAERVLWALPAGREQDSCRAYLMGFLCHYALDSLCHPFVYGRTGFDPNGVDKYYYSRHAELENAIDQSLLAYFRAARVLDLHEEAVFSLPKADRLAVSKFMSASCREAFGRYFRCGSFFITPRFLRLTIDLGRVSCRLLRDPKKRKYRFLYRVESVFSLSHLASDKLTLEYPRRFADCLNLRRRPWKNPWDASLHCDTFLDLFRQAVKLSLTLLTSLNTDSFLSVVGNRSYHSGLPL